MCMCVCSHVSTCPTQLGWRASDPTVGGRHFHGALAEILVYDGALNSSAIQAAETYLNTKYKRTPSDLLNCTAGSGQVVTGTVPAPEGHVSFHIALRLAAPALPASSLPTLADEARARTEEFSTRVTAKTPDTFMDGALGPAVTAVDGLWRDATPVFVHGAMGWDVPLVGWRSEYGGTVLGDGDYVAREGAYMFGNQVSVSVDLTFRGKLRCGRDEDWMFVSCR
jgi:hypothetical protein